ncbi:hypothetical protein [Pseudomonas akapageensis]|uniref:hypothetical protein n=1 Tax=Pseudomonas akapageensis TaxID=2609961 RepID=UPI00140E5818|nr:hypothetical protein [Pseudomonas akapageensis]
MATVTPDSACKYLKELALPGLARGFDFEGGPSLDFDALKDQAAVVGSEVVSFAKGVSAEHRQDITDCTLLAQLAANRKITPGSGIFDWYNDYFAVLENLGWVIQSKSFDVYHAQADGLETHEAILKVAAGLLGAGSGALAIVVSTLEAMKSMDADNPWITIFNRESRRAKATRFQIALAQQQDNGALGISMMAFALEADAVTTQVLFFKVRSDALQLEHCSGQVTVDEAVLTGVRDALREKLIGRSKGFIDSIDLG